MQPISLLETISSKFLHSCRQMTSQTIIRDCEGFLFLVFIIKSLGKYYREISFIFFSLILIFFHCLSFLLCCFFFWFIIGPPSNHYLLRSSKRLSWTSLMQDPFLQGTKDALFCWIPVSVRVRWSPCQQTIDLICGLSTWLTAS